MAKYPKNQRKETSKRAKIHPVELPIKKPRKTPAKSRKAKSSALKVGLSDVSSREQADSLANTFTLVKIVSIISQQIKTVQASQSASSGTSDEEDNVEDQNRHPNSRLDVMKFRSPSPPKPSSARKRSVSSDRPGRCDSSSRVNSPKSKSRRYSNSTQRRRTRSRSSAKYKTSSRSRRDSSHDGRSRRISVKSSARTSKGTNCRPLKGILKDRIGKYPNPRSNTPCHGRSKKKIRFRKIPEIRFYYCNLAKARRNMRYRNRQQ